MKYIILIISLLSITSLSAQNEIKGSQDIAGLEITDDFWFDYEATIKYRLVLFGGVKFDVNVVEVRLSNIKFEGVDVPDSVFEALNLKQTDQGALLIKRGLYDVRTDVEFQNCFFKDSHGNCGIRVRDIDILAVGWGSIDEYTYLKDNKVKELKAFFNITKPDDFYTLDAELIHPKITKFNIGILQDIKNEMNKLKSKEELIAQKMKKLNALKANRYLSLEKLKSKKQLLKELIELEVEDCMSFHSCEADIKAVEKAIIIKPLKALKPNKDLTLEKLKYKKQLLEELIELEVQDCLSYQSCENDMKDVKKEIMRRENNFEMTEKETIIWITNMLNKGISLFDIDEVININVTSCEINFQVIHKYFSTRKKTKNSIKIPLKNGTDRFFREYSRLASSINEIENIDEDNHLTLGKTLFYLDSRNEEDSEKLLKAIKHLSSFCK